MGTNCRTLIALIPFVIAIPGLIAALILSFWPPLPNDLNSIVSGLVGAILAFDIPICIVVLLQWFATGELPELSLSPLIPTREEREFRRELRERPKLNDDEFYNTFYSNSPIPKRLAIQLRASLENAIGLDFGALHPTDNLINADVELDWADIFFRINREFDVVVPEEMRDTLDGTFDALLRCIAKLSEAVSMINPGIVSSNEWKLINAMCRIELPGRWPSGRKWWAEVPARRGWAG